MLQESTALDTWEYFVYLQINFINPTFKNTKNIKIKYQTITLTLHTSRTMMIHFRTC